jgi:hypothetical protein
MVKKLFMSFEHLQRQLRNFHHPRLRVAPSSKETEASTTASLAPRRAVRVLDLDAISRGP